MARVEFSAKLKVYSDVQGNSHINLVGFFFSAITTIFLLKSIIPIRNTNTKIK